MDHSRIVQLAQFDINTDKLQDSVLESQKRLIDLNKEIYKSVQAMAQLQKSIDAANKTSDALNNSNKKTGDAYVETNKNVIELMESEKKLMEENKKLRAERDKLQVSYNNEKALLDEVNKKNLEVSKSQQQVTKDTKDASKNQDDLNAAINREVNTRAQAKQNTKELNKLKDQLNVNVEEEAALLDLVNEKVNRNNQLLAESGSELEKRRANVGNYTASIQDAFAELDIFNGGLTGFIQRSSQAGGAGELLKGSITQMTTAMGGLIKSTLAFLATPLGIVLAVLTAAFLLIRNAMNRSEEATNKINKVFGAFSGVLNFVLKALEPLGELLIDGIVKGFEMATNTAKLFIAALDWIGNNAADILSALGFEGAATNVKLYTTATTSLANAMIGAAEAGSKLAEMEAKLQTEQRKSELIQEQYEVRAERLRQLRDDETRTIQQRIESNAELGRVLKQQLNEELRIAKLALDIANEKLKTEGSNTANIEAQAKALVAIEKINNRITGQESEQQSNINSLRREAQAQAKTAADARIKQIEKEISKQKEALELFIAEQGIRSKTLLEQYKLQEEVSKKSIAILDRELKNKKISQEKYNLEVLKLSQETARLQAEISVQIAEKNLDAFVYENQEKLKNGQLLTDALLAQELERNRSIANERDKFAKTQFENGLINNDELNRALLENQRTYLAEEKTLKEKNQADNRTIETTRRAQEFQENMLLLQENLASEFEIRKAQAQFELDENKLQLEQQRADGLITEENYQLALNNIIANNNQVRKQIEKDLFAVKLDYAQRGLDALAQIAGKDTAAAKAVGVAKVGIDTAMAIMKSYSDLGPIGGSIFAAIVGTLGAINIKKIVSTKEPKVDTNIKMAKGGLTEIGGKRHSQGGTKFVGEDGTRFEAEKGELIGVMNRSAAANFMNYNNSFLSGGSKTYPNYFADGGIVGLKPSNNAAVLQNLFGNFDTSSITEAVRQGAMEGTQQGSFEGSYQGSQVGSQQGISQLSSDRAMQGDSLL